jgi:hypothetical protein
MPKLSKVPNILQWVTFKSKRENMNESDPGPMVFIEYFFHNMRKEGVKVNDLAETIFVAGCYVGEVMIRNAGGQWTNLAEVTGLPENMIMMPIVVTLDNGYRANPIAKAFKLFYNGETDSIVYFYTVFTSLKTSEDVLRD